MNIIARGIDAHFDREFASAGRAPIAATPAKETQALLERLRFTAERGVFRAVEEGKHCSYAEAADAIEALTRERDAKDALLWEALDFVSEGGAECQQFRDRVRASIGPGMDPRLVAYLEAHDAALTPADERESHNG